MIYKYRIRFDIHLNSIKFYFVLYHACCHAFGVYSSDTKVQLLPKSCSALNSELFKINFKNRVYAYQDLPTGGRITPFTALEPVR